MTPLAVAWRDVLLPLVRAVDLWVLSMLGIYCLHYIFQMITAYRELRQTQRESTAVTPWWNVYRRMNSSSRTTAFWIVRRINS